MNFATDFFSHKKKKLCRIDMAPLVDIIFLLLIFFMLGSDFTRPSLALELPEASSSDDNRIADIRISVDRHSTIFVNRQQTSLEDLEPLLQRQLVETSRKSVIFSGDRATPYELFVRILALVNRAGAVTFSVEHEKGE